MILQPHETDHETDKIPISGPAEKDGHYTWKNGYTVVFGDVGTTRIIRSVCQASKLKYKWITTCPGDLHAGGYLEEAISKIYGPTFVYHAAYNILQRRLIVPESYGTKKNFKITT